MKKTQLSVWIVAVLTISSAKVLAEEPRDKEDERLAGIIHAIRTNEELYNNLETTVKRTIDIVDPGTEDGTLHRLFEETRHTVRQGELIHFQGEETRTRSAGDPVRRRRLSSFDGENTVSIEYGNSVNIHLGRYEASQIVPPHCWSVTQLGVNFPLSVLLGGTEVIRKHPKFRSHRVETGAVYEFAKVECRSDGMADVEGIECVKIRCDRWYRSAGNPVVSYFWLAPERNYLCVKSQTMFDDWVRSESMVETFRQIAPRTWLPERVVIKDYIIDKQDRQRRLHRQLTRELQHVVFNPAHPSEFFRQIDIPENLPVFSIKDGILKSSPVLSEADQSSDERLAEIVEAVRTNEKHFTHVEIVTTEKYRLLSEGMHGASFVSHMAVDATQRSIVLGDQAFVSEENTVQLADATSSKATRVRAHDGEWTRTLIEKVRDRGSGSTSQCNAALQRGRSDSLSPYRPHTAALRATHQHRSLSEILTSETGGGRDARQRRPNQKVEYLGKETFNGLACEVLRITSKFPGREHASRIRIVWLANERNYIPIRNESYTLRWSESLPTAVTIVDDLREIDSGVWFPFHVVTHRFEGFNVAGLAEGRLIVQWQREHTVNRVARGREVPPEVFRTISVPAGTKVSVFDSSGEFLGTFRQSASGNISISAEELEAMKVHAEERNREKEEQIAAMDAVVGLPAPVLPDENWLNSDPLSWSDLAGKVVLLDFWAIWCGPCHSDLERLAETYESLNDSGIMVIGVHTAGSTREDVKKVAEEQNLGYPICIDTPPEEGRAWGNVFSHFAVRQLPHAYVIDKTGKVAAHGELEQVLVKAASLTK